MKKSVCILLILEVIVQIIESAFYFWLAYNFTKIINVTPKRYIDWVITTPTMLITLILYLIYLNKKGNNETNDLELSEWFIKTKWLPYIISGAALVLSLFTFFGLAIFLLLFIFI